MLLTIVIPVYNTAAYLEACVQSVLSGDHQDCEILLVDDGSTDGVCPALCDPAWLLGRVWEDKTYT